MNDKKLEVWSIRESNKDPNDLNPRSYWKHAGRAFVNSDGSINVLLDVLPIDGKLQIRKRRESDIADEQRRTNPERNTDSIKVTEPGTVSA